jgi:putative thiamine transport system substrate-binding protein
MLRALTGLLLLAALATASRAQTPDPHDWDAVLAEARGQTVYFHAWAGDPQINAFIAWAGEQLQAQHGVSLQHVKIGDTAESVARILAERMAGNADRGSVDLLWVNGENFAALKANDLLYGPFAEALPNFPLVQADRFPEMREDFTIPVDGYESPWTRSRLVFYFDPDVLPEPPLSMVELLAWSQANPGLFTYPRPPDFLGSTFLKQALLELVAEREGLYQSVDPAQFDAVTAPLWAFLDALHPTLLRGGRSFPGNGGELRRMLGDGEIALAFSFSPAEASAGILAGELPPTVRSFVPRDGSIGNVSFLAIPFNAPARAGALVAANYLLSPEAQARAYSPEVMGSTTVLSMEALSAVDRARFEAIDPGPATLPPQALGAPLREPHPSWMEALEQAWLARYGVR